MEVISITDGESDAVATINLITPPLAFLLAVFLQGNIALHLHIMGALLANDIPPSHIVKCGFQLNRLKFNHF